MRNQHDPATIKWMIMHATFLALAAYGTAATASDPWADRVIDAHPDLDAGGIYDDPAAVLGPPTEMFLDFLIGQADTVSLANGPFNVDAVSGSPLVTTLSTGRYLVVKFDEPVTDDTRNPFGIDLLVFGNDFFIASAPVTPATDMATVSLTGVMFAESVTVAVSPTGIGTPETHPAEWYVYAIPTADGLYPSNPFAWDSDNSTWGEPLDATRPVNPGLQPSDLAGLSIAHAIDSYDCAAGGTGFDLADSGFTAIQYVRLTGSGGEVDALADVFPSLGDFDRDGDVDLADAAIFTPCLGDGTVTPPVCACRDGDVDGDRRVTLDDWRMNAAWLEGPNAP